MSARSYHHGDLRAALVREAVTAAIERGPDGLSLRELARRVGVSHNAAYRHFADRDALLEAVASEGLRRMMALLRARLDAVPDVGDPVVRARRRLAALARGYVEFAVTEPGLFRVTFTSFPSLGDPREIEVDPELDTFGLLGEMLDGLVEVGYLDPAARPATEISCWSAVHGFALLHLDGPLRQVSTSDREALLDNLVVTLDRSLGATTGQPFVPLEP